MRRTLLNLAPSAASDVIELGVTLLNVLFRDGDEERLRHMILGSAHEVADLDDRELVRGERALWSDNEWRMGWLVLMCAALGLGNVTGAIGAGRVSAHVDTEHSMNCTRAALKVTQNRDVAPFDLLIASSAASDRGGVNCKVITFHHKIYMELFCSRLGSFALADDKISCEILELLMKLRPLQAVHTFSLSAAGNALPASRALPACRSLELTRRL